MVSADPFGHDASAPYGFADIMSVASLVFSQALQSKPSKPEMLKGLWDEFCVLRRALFPMQRRSCSQWIYDEEPESLTVNASS